MKEKSIGILHYSAPPVIGGVEAVMKAHVNEFIRDGYSCTVIAGRGKKSALPSNTRLINISEIDSNHPEIISISNELELGRVPDSFETLELLLTLKLKPIFENLDHLIIHNVLTKHFNLPLTKAIHNLMEQGSIKHLIPWCHDFTWTSPSSRSKMHEGVPWDLLRKKWPDSSYVTVSKERQQTLAALLNCPIEDIKVIYNGVNPKQVLGISNSGWEIIRRLDMLESDLNVLMPVRVTKAKNIEFAIEVAAVIKNKGCNPRFVLTGPPDPHDAGSMSYYQSLRDYRDQLGVTKNLRFIFESGSEPDQPLMIDEDVVGDLFRISDMMFMPSHREGFGMPILEAGAVGIPIVSRGVPAAKELAGEEAVIFKPEATSKEVASLLLRLLDQSPIARLKRRIRKEYTWEAIFESNIKPLLKSGSQN